MTTDIPTISPSSDNIDLQDKQVSEPAAPLSPPIPSPPLYADLPSPKSEDDRPKPDQAPAEPAEPAEPAAADQSVDQSVDQPAEPERAEIEPKSEHAEADPAEPAVQGTGENASKRPLDDQQDGERAHSTLPKHQSKFVLSMLRSLKRLKDAYPFLVPVDPVKLNIPDYFKVVTSPMDLSTMEKKVLASEYDSVDSFVADFDLMIDNCVRFNGAESKIAEMGRSLKASFDRQFKQLPPADLKPEQSSKKRKITKAEEQQFALTPSGMPIIRRDSSAADNSGRPKREIHPPKPKDLPYSEFKPRRKKYAAELKFCQTVLKELLSKKHESYSFPFLQPVDPVALNCPTYFKIIKSPMDLSTIEKKLNTNQYETGAEFEEDVRLMFRNCYKFNPDGSPVNVLGHRLEAVFDKKWLEKPAPQPTRVVSESEDEDESDEDEESDDDDTADKTISLLEQQLLAMQSQLIMMKKQKKDSSGKKKKKDKGKKVLKRRKSSVSSASVPHVSYEMKKELSEKINTLSTSKLTHVVKIIHESMPHLRSQGQDEIELDVDQLDPVTLVKLYNYVTKNSPNTAIKTSAPVSPKPRKKKAEQKKQIAQLQKQLKSIKDGEASTEESSDEDDSAESESSSEEE